MRVLTGWFSSNLSEKKKKNKEREKYKKKKSEKSCSCSERRRERGNAVEAESVRWEKGRERARERVKEIQLFFHFTSSKKPFSSHSERAEGKLGELCDSWWNFVQLLLVSQHNLLNHFRGSLNRLRRSFPVCDTRKRGRKGKNFVIFATIISPPRYLYLYIPQDRISKDFWIYAVWKEREKERMRASERAKW